MYAIVFFRVVWCGMESTECVPFLCQKKAKRKKEREKVTMKMSVNTKKIVLLLLRRISTTKGNSIKV